MPGICPASALGGTSTASATRLMSAAGGTDTANYVQRPERGIRARDADAIHHQPAQLLQSNAPNASVQQVLGGWQIVPADQQTTAAQAGVPITTNLNGDDAGRELEQPADQPDVHAERSAFAGTNYQWFMPQLQGQRLALTFDSNGLAQLWQDDTLVAQHSTSGERRRPTSCLSVTHPDG